MAYVTKCLKAYCCALMIANCYFLCAKRKCTNLFVIILYLFYVYLFIIYLFIKFFFFLLSTAHNPDTEHDVTLSKTIFQHCCC